MILRWMKDGEIEDEHGDFFIVENSSTSYWNNSHALRLVKNVIQIIQKSICRYIGNLYINSVIVQLTH